MVEVTNTIKGLTLAGLVIITVFFVGSQGEGVIELSGTYGDIATCSATSCYFDINVTSNYAGNVSIFPIGVRATDESYNGYITSSDAFKEVIINETYWETEKVEKSYVCTEKVKEKDKENETEPTKYKCVKKDKEDEVLFDQDYTAFISANSTFLYDDYIEVEKVKQVKVKSKDEIILTPTTKTEIIRVEFTAPLNTAGKFDVEVDVYIDGEKQTFILDPWYATGNYQYKRAITDFADVIMPINASGIYEADIELIDGSGQNSQIYAYPCGTTNAIYYNDSDTYTVVGDDTTECFSFCTDCNSTINYNSTPSTDNLTFYLTFDENEATVKDYSGHGLTGTITSGTPTLGAAVIDNGRAFVSGDTEYVTFGSNHDELNLNKDLTGEFTVCVWTKPTVVDASINYNMIASNHDTGWCRWGVSQERSISNVSFSMFDSDTSISLDLGVAGGVNNWQHVCFVRIYGSNLTGYSNGEQTAYMEGTWASSITPCLATNNVYMIGAFYRLGVEYYGNFVIDEVRHYDRALSADEVKAIYDMNATLGAQETEISNLSTITWTGDYNTTITIDSHTFNWTTDQGATHCNLTLDGTWYNQTNTSVAQTDWSQAVTSLSEGNYTPINVTCNDAYDTVVSDNVWLFVDTVPPVVTWDWDDANTSILVNYTLISVSLDEAGNCTLHFNGSDTANATLATSFSWNVTSLSDGNYSTVNVTCDDASDNEGITTNSWVKIFSINETLNVHINAGIATSFSLPITAYTQTNVTPTNQTATDGIFEVTNNLSSALVYIAVKTNETINTCLTVYLDPTPSLNTTSRYTITDEWQLIPFVLATSGDRDIWFAITLYFCPGGDLDFDFDFAGVI